MSHNTMKFGTNFVVVLCVCAIAGEARRSPNADLVEEYFGPSGPEGGGRFSDNILEDALLDVPDLIRRYGYPSEVHNPVTEDGYILELHRIPHGRDQNFEPGIRRPAVLIVHGLYSSSSDWVIMGPGTAFGYILAESGFDVWLGNCRGNFYSRRHLTLDPDNDDVYWKFSWEEFGRFDLPAMIDHILNTTGLAGVHYVGHSQGTTSFWAMGALRPEYNSKIVSMQAFAPVAYMHYNDFPAFRLLGPLSNGINFVAGQLGIDEMISRPAAGAWAGRTICADGSPLQPICTNLLFFIAGYGPSQHNATMFPVKLAHSPAGGSLQQLVHYGQHIGNDFFRRYDHGPLTNFRIYGSFDPPSFDLGKITAPVYLHYVDPDHFAAMEDVNRLWRELGRPMEMLRVPYEPFSHLDFAWGQNAKGVLYDRTIEIMRRFEN